MPGSGGRASVRRKDDVALMIAEGRYTYKDIADIVGISVNTIQMWRHQPEFVERIEYYTKLRNIELENVAIGRVRERVAAQNERWHALQEIVRERAKAVKESGAKFPGGLTGHLVIQLKSLHDGKSSKVVEEIVLDAALLKELRELEKQAAMELGQWQTFRDVNPYTATPHAIPEDDPRFMASDEQPVVEGDEDEDASP